MGVIGEKFHKRLYKEVGKDLGYHQDTVEAAVREVFKLVNSCITGETDKGVRIQSFGVFHVPPKRRESIEKRRQAALERRISKEFPYDTEEE